MREILFRGKRIDNGEWVYGYIIQKNDVDAECITESYIIDRDEFTMSCDFNTRFIDLEPIKVDTETVGQDTGLKDCNGKKIWENDIVKHCVENRPAIVNFIDGKFTIEKDGYNLSASKCFKVIGNIHDNPELLILLLILNGE